MGQKPLTDSGGNAARIAVRIPPGDRARVHAAAGRRGLTLSEYARTVLLDAVEADAQEATKAS